jgi:hypothetical protein
MPATLAKPGGKSWTPDRQCSECQVCRRGFTAVRRRHHCRLCGQLLCYECSAYRASKGIGGEIFKSPQRACAKCFADLHQIRAPQSKGEGSGEADGDEASSSSDGQLMGMEAMTAVGGSDDSSSGEESTGEEPNAAETLLKLQFDRAVEGEPTPEPVASMGTTLTYWNGRGLCESVRFMVRPSLQLVPLVLAIAP